jgi:hypothetical protein
MKKLCIVGRGTVGCLAAAHFLRYTDWDIVWMYDPSVPAAAVGEGTTLITPRSLSNTLDWTWNDISDMDGAVKTGIYKQGWGAGDFTHAFPSGFVGMHFNAVQFQEKAFKRISNEPRVTTIEGQYTSGDELDADFILVCTGSSRAEGDFLEHPEIPVNAAYVTQCYWDAPMFTHTLTIARPWGWVFGIPLRNRCSIGYLYNAGITDLDVIKDDVQAVFEQFDLAPSDQTNSLKFRNYSRVENFTPRVAHNGNASFFLEPLEATSTTTADEFNRYAYDIWNKRGPADMYNELYRRDIEDVKAMICLHYFAGSKYDTPFWSQAREGAEGLIARIFSDPSHSFRDNALKAMDGKLEPEARDVGTWGRHSYEFNIRKLGIEQKLRSIVQAGTFVQM